MEQLTNERTNEVSIDTPQSYHHSSIYRMRLFRCARLRATGSAKVLGLLSVLFISMAIRLRHYRSVMTSGLFVARDKNSSILQSHERTQTNSSTRFSQKQDGDFEQILWPKLKQSICPDGVPKTSLGPSLFELGRIEFGLAANATAASRSDDIWRNRQRTSHFFYDGGFGFTVFLDGEDPSNTLLYSSVWKCANDQIHSYFHTLLNRRINGTIRDPSGYIQRDNDIYGESLNIKDLETLFHEELKRSKASNKDLPLRNDAYFTFNKTSRSKPCVFSVLRDPISHFLSGYNEVEYRLVHDVGGAPKLPDDGHKLASYTKIPVDDDSDMRERRFHTFVKNLLKEHPSFSTFDYYKHFASMSRMLPTLSRFNLLPPEKSSSWYLPTLDHLTDTFPAFLANRCPIMARNYQQRQHQCHLKTCENNKDDNAIPFPPMERMGLHESSNDADGTYKAAKDVWNRGGSVARALCALHAIDYACFDFSLPPVCRNVYSSERFVHTIIQHRDKLKT